jgi:hypothetical protein
MQFNQKYKIYACIFTNNKHTLPDPNKVLVKIGITHHTDDIMKRFDPKIDDGYPKNYSDWDIECKFSMICNSKEEAEQIEKQWLGPNGIFSNPGPTKVWVENLFNLEDNNYYRDNTGITELRLLTHKQAKWAFWKLHEMKRERYEHNK